MPRHFPDWLHGYMEYTRSSESPEQFHFWTGVSTIAGALRGKVWRSENQFRWTPNFYIILVGPAGAVQKSTSINLGMELLEQVPDIHFGPPSATWQALVKTMADSAMHVEYTDPAGVDQSFTVSCVTLPVSELGTFMKLASEGFAEVLIDMWDGQIRKRNWAHATATTGTTTIQNPWLNMIGATTPTWLKNNFPESQIGGGLTSRLVFVYGDKKQRLVAYPSQQWHGKEYFVLKERLIEDLMEIAALKGHFELTSAAFRYGEEWYVRLHEARPLHIAHERFDAYLARKQTFLHKLAMINSAATGNSLVLDRHHLEWADKLLVSVEQHMIHAFQAIGLTDQFRQVEEIVALLRTHKQLTLNQLFNFLRNNMDSQTFLQAIQAGVMASVLELHDRNIKGQTKKVVTLTGDTPPEAI